MLQLPWSQKQLILKPQQHVHSMFSAYSIQKTTNHKPEYKPWSAEVLQLFKNIRFYNRTNKSLVLAGKKRLRKSSLLTTVSSQIKRHSGNWPHSKTDFEICPFTSIQFTCKGGTSGNTPPTHLPFRANSIDLIAVVLLVPVVTRKEATRSWVSVFKTKIWKLNKQKLISFP